MELLLKTFTCVKKAQKQENALILRKLVLKAVQYIELYKNSLPNKYYVLSENSQRFICKIYSSSESSRLNICNIMSHYRIEADEEHKY